MSESEPNPHRLRELSWPAVESYLEEHHSSIAIVPIGSTEQHGPHLPLGVDAFQAIDLADAIAEESGALVAPPIWYGDADHHLAFPGTVSLSTETTVAVLTDVYSSLASHGFEIVVTVNGHRVANLTAIETAMQAGSKANPDVSFAAIDPLRIGIHIHRELRDGDPEDGMHGGEFETSFMLARYPDLVDEAEFVPETSATPTSYHSNDLVGFDDMVLSPATPHHPDEHRGHVGDPTHATVEKGEALFERLVRNGVEFIAELEAERL